MTKVLVAVPNCHKDNWKNCPNWLLDHSPELLAARATPEERRACVRETWWNKQPYDYRFFFGLNGGRKPLADEVFLEVPDDFEYFAQKNKAICRWAIEQKYDWMFHCDDDTYVRRLELPTHGDQIGRAPFGFGGKNYICGGSGYWLSRKAMQLLVADRCAYSHEDDVWIGQVMQHPTIERVHDPRYYQQHPHLVIPSLLPNGWLTCHSCTPNVMRELWQIQTSQCWPRSPASALTLITRFGVEKAHCPVPSKA